MSSATLTYKPKTAKNRACPQNSFRYLTGSVPPREGVSLRPAMPLTSATKRGRNATLDSTRPRDTRPGNCRPAKKPFGLLGNGGQAGQLPDPRRWAAQIARCTLEAVEGERPLSQLTRWISPQQYQLLERRRRRANQKPTAGIPRNGHAEKRLRPVSVLSARCRATLDGAQEATVILHDGFRGRATALRLENRGNYWLVTSLKLG